MFADFLDEIKDDRESLKCVRNLLVEQCNRMISISQASLDHSGSDIGFMINSFTVQTWKQKKKEVKKLFRELLKNRGG